MQPRLWPHVLGLITFPKANINSKLDLRFRPHVHSAFSCALKTAALWLGDTRNGFDWQGGGENTNLLPYKYLILNMLS